MFKRMMLVMLSMLALSPSIVAGGTTVVGDAARAGFDEFQRQIIRRYLGQQTAESHGHEEDERHQDYEDSGRGKHKHGKGHKGNKGRDKSLPPGLAKRDHLPPGLERQLERNGKLPPGLRRRDLPPELEDRLGPPPSGTERLMVGDDVLIVEKTTGLIRDIIRHVFD